MKTNNAIYPFILFLTTLLCVSSCRQQSNQFEFSTDEAKIVVSLLNIQDTIFDVQAEVYHRDGSQTQSVCGDSIILIEKCVPKLSAYP